MGSKYYSTQQFIIRTSLILSSLRERERESLENEDLDSDDMLKGLEMCNDQKATVCRTLEFKSWQTFDQMRGGFVLHLASKDAVD